MLQNSIFPSDNLSKNVGVEAQTVRVKDLVRLRSLGLQNYDQVWQQMQDFTDARDDQTADELWMLEHRPVFTLGQAGKHEHVLQASDIPVVRCDRGGQVTYHGPGQLVVYTLVDLKRRKIGVREFVNLLEQSLIDALKHFDISAQRSEGAPGVYVGQAKIAALGLRLRRGRAFHGVSLNVNMDMKPFSFINPCGYAGLEVAQIRDLVAAPNNLSVLETGERFCNQLISHLGYQSVDHQ